VAGGVNSRQPLVLLPLLFRLELFFLTLVEHGVEEYGDGQAAADQQEC
jgi:hypothetical protein